MEAVIGFMTTTGYLAAPILLAALGGLLCEKSGVVNLALEGLMISGAFSAAVVQVLLQKGVDENTWVLSLIAGGIFGLLMATIFAYAIVTQHADQTVTGVAMNLLTLGLSIFIVQIIFRREQTPTFLNGMPSDPWFNLYPSVYIALFFFLLVFFFLRYTQTGLRLSACGENPEAVEAAGLRVRRFRYLALLSSGLLAGLGGACLVLTQTTQYSRFTINGQGYIALSAVAFAQWKSERVLLAVFMFGAALTIAVYSTNIDWLKVFPSELFSAFPYALNIFALIIFSRSGAAPKSLGRSYLGL